VASATTDSFPSALNRAAAVPSFDEIYDQHVAFVWRSVRRLGVDASAVDDVVQDVFLVVHRKLAEFEGTAALRTWLFGIVLKVVRQRRRAVRRKPANFGEASSDAFDPAEVPAPADRGPYEQVAEREAMGVLYALLDQLDDDQREVFVLVELERMSVPEIAQALELNLSTVYSRLRLARRDFERAVARHRAQNEWRWR
jgi:RNA polymerase sigma-70 factor (ECF subfamily)